MHASLIGRGQPILVMRKTNYEWHGCGSGDCRHQSNDEIRSNADHASDAASAVRRALTPLTIGGESGTQSRNFGAHVSDDARIITTLQRGHDVIGNGCHLGFFHPLCGD